MFLVRVQPGGGVGEEAAGVTLEPGLAVDFKGLCEREAAFERGLVGGATGGLGDEGSGVGHC